MKEENAGLTSDLDATRLKLKSTEAQQSALQQQCKELRLDTEKKAREAESLHTSWTECATIREGVLQVSAGLIEQFVTCKKDLEGPRAVPTLEKVCLPIKRRALRPLVTLYMRLTA